MFFTLDNGIKYLGLIAIIYFLVKAFVHDKINNKQTAMLVTFITVPIIALCMQISYEKRRGNWVRENYTITDPPITSSIYPGPPNSNPVLGKVNIPPKSSVSPETGELINYLNIDKAKYEGLLAEEERAKDKIRQSYTNEMVFTQTDPINTVPQGTQLYGYTYLPPENWVRAYERPPVCIMDKNNVVNGIGEGNKYVELLEFDSKSNAMRNFIPTK